MVELLNNIFNIIINVNFYVPIIICLLLVIAGQFLKPIYGKMKNVLFTFQGIIVDWWSISHIILYIYFGYKFPNSFAEFLIIGSIWEVIEAFLCRENFEKITQCRDSENIVCRNMRKFNSCDYWYGRIDDVAMNMIGFTIGAAIHKTTHKNQSHITV